ncbi:MAG TPA: N-6 DNA methylase, partial [Vicinamibacterales bacterium]|nr:N-6 DNA methylase [Vicinamibacterales bacterium]
SEAVLNALWPGAEALADAFEQSLTLVYRLLFLLFAEARGLTPLWHPIYQESYSVAALRDAVDRTQPATGLWDALRAMSRLAHAGCRAGDLSVTAFNGRLFSPSRTPLADRRGLDDEAARTALIALSRRSSADRSGMERIEYRDLGVEQLGAVYETLLDYEPHVDKKSTETRAPASDRRRTASNARVTLRNTSHARKASGTFYTPQPIAQYLVRRTLGPLVKGRTAEEIVALRILDPAMGSGAFLVAACRYLQQAYQTALVEQGACHQSDLGPTEQAAIRRTIAERCLYGVDRNPMAVQLARLSLWLATLAADKPLNFLDHHLASGDSLLGTWVGSLSQPPRERRRRAADDTNRSLFADGDLESTLRDVLPIRFSLADTADLTAETVRGKERSLASLGRHDAPLSKWKRVANLWCAHWFSGSPSSTFLELADFILTGRSALPPATVSACLATSDRISDERRFFHWELEFPEVFFDPSGIRRSTAGFDAVIGNPPWDMIRNDDGTGDRGANRSGVVRFTRDSGVYRWQSDGHANCYQLFAERIVSLTRVGGRFGLVVPSGLVMDRGSARLRRLLLSQCDVDSLIGFDNHRQIFPIHRSVRFHLLTASRGGPTASIDCRLGQSDAAILDGADEEPRGSQWFPLRVTPALLERLSGAGLDIPDLRAPVDLAIAERAAMLFPPLGAPAGWRAQFGRELNATEDRASLSGNARGMPVVEGKTLDAFRVDLGATRFTITVRNAVRLIGSRCLQRRLAYRDVASATNRMTLIAAMLPAGSVSTHTLLCLKTALSSREQYFLCGLFNSFVVNYLVRMRVSTHVTATIVEQLPIPVRDQCPEAFEAISAMARYLGRAIADSRRSDVLARLNARVARLYQLSSGELTHVLSTFPLVDAAVRDATLRFFLEGC